MEKTFFIIVIIAITVVILLITFLVIKVSSSGVPLMMKLSRSQFQYVAPYIYIFYFLFQVNNDKFNDVYSLYFNYNMCKNKYFLKKLVKVNNTAEEYDILEILLEPVIEIVKVSKKKQLDFLEYNLVRMSPKEYVKGSYMNWYFYVMHLTFRNECLKLINEKGSYQVTLAALLTPDDPIEDVPAYYSRSLYISSKDEKNVNLKRVDMFAIEYILIIKVQYKHHQAVEFFSISNEIVDRNQKILRCDKSLNEISF